MSPGRRGAGRRRGRSLVAGLLVGFVIVAAAVIWRRGFGVAHASQVQTLQRQRTQLQAERTSLERRIADLTGRARLGDVAEHRLDMHIPADSQVIVLPAPATRSDAKRPSP